MKRPPTKWETTFAKDIGEKRLVSGIYNILLQCHYKKGNNPV